MTDRTVLILGAGASCDAKFPCGPKLIDEIITFYRDQNNIEWCKRVLWNNRKKIINNKLLSQLPNEVATAIQREDATQFFTQLGWVKILSWINNLGAAESIDNFIAKRKDCAIIVKLAILIIISKYENSSFFDPRLTTDNKRSFEINRIWYHYFWYKLCNGCNTLIDLINKMDYLRIITFNYDRSIEYFLSRKIEALFNTEPEASRNEAIDKLSTIIIHVFGQIGALIGNKSQLIKSDYKPVVINIDRNIVSSPFIVSQDGEPNWSVQYLEIDGNDFDLAMGIKTITESIHKEIAENINFNITVATHLYLFGFGFHSENMEILFGQCLPNKDLTLIDGTQYMMSENDLKIALDIFNRWTKTNSCPLLRNIYEIKLDEPERRTMKIGDFIDRAGLHLNSQLE